MLEDQEILSKIADGDQSSFDTLFRKYHRYLVTISFSYTKDLNISRDLSQEVFLDLWNRRKVIKITSSLKSFLRRAVINQSMTAMKSKKHASSIEDQKLAIAASDDSSSAVEYSELQDKIKEIVDHLPERCQEIFKLSRFENKSHKEIAAMLDISTKTIENQMTKALRTLRQGLKEADFISISVFFIAIHGGSML